MPHDKCYDPIHLDICDTVPTAFSGTPDACCGATPYVSSVHNCCNGELHTVDCDELQPRSLFFNTKETALETAEQCLFIVFIEISKFYLFNIVFSIILNSNKIFIFY